MSRRSPARLSDREFIQLLADLGTINLCIDPSAPLSEWEISFILSNYHRNTQ
jgi:hypothetical protein